MDKALIASKNDLDLMGRFIRHALSLIEFERNGKPAPVDQIAEKRGMSSLVSGGKGQRIQYKSSISYRFDAPLTFFMQRVLEYLLHYFVLSYRGEVVEVDGFRLKHIDRWRSSRPQSLFDNLGSPSGYCNLRCKFCYERSGALPLERSLLTLGEAAARARHYNHGTATGIITPINHYAEPFCNPNLIDILRLVREKSPQEEFLLYTNGSLFTEEIVKQLSELKPVNLGVSLNSANPSIRRQLMGDPNAERSIEAIKWLCEHRLRFGGSLVAWPSIPLDDMANTILYLDKWQSISIVIHLPSYTRYFPREMQFDTEAAWSRVVSLVKELRTTVKTPLLFSIGSYANPAITPIVEGIYRNSPAERTGLKIGDRILSVNGKEVVTKFQTLQLLSPLGQDQDPIPLTFRRDGAIWEAALSYDHEIGDDWYPFKPAGYGLPPFPSGIHLAQDFLVDYLITLLRLQRQKNAHSILLFSTPFIKPLLLQVLEVKTKIKAALEGMELRIEIAPNYFWGGNICIGDLNVVQDFIDHLKNHVLADKSYRPDLIIIPSSFTVGKGFDILGVSYLEIERQLGIPVELLPCHKIAP